MMGKAGQQYVVASDAGYGFVAKVDDLYSKNRAGKAVISVPAGAGALVPRRVTNESAKLAVVTTDGHLLVFPVAELPDLARGKGVKLIHVPPAKLKSREEVVVDVAVLQGDDRLTVFAGKRHLTLKPGDLEHYSLGRGRRGKLLPRGLRRVDALEIVSRQREVVEEEDEDIEGEN